MGIVSLIAVAAGIGFFISLTRKINEISERETDEDVSWVLTWGARFSGLIALLGVVGIVNAYIYEFPDPLEKDGIELPAEHTPPEQDGELPEIKKAEKPDPMKDAQESHRDAMDDFEKRNKPE